MPRIEYNENGDVVLRVVKSINVNFEIINYIYEFMKKNKIPTFSKAVEQIISEHMLYNKLYNNLSKAGSNTENQTHQSSTEPAETTEPEQSPTLTGQSIPRSPGGPNSENSKIQENEKTESGKSSVLEKSENTRKT